MGLNNTLDIYQTTGWTELEPKTLTVKLESFLKAPHTNMSEPECLLLMLVLYYK